MSEKEEGGLHQLHIEVPLAIYEELKEVLPERGLITSLVRRFLQQYVTEYRRRKAEEGVSESPLDTATRVVVDANLLRGR